MNRCYHHTPVTQTQPCTWDSSQAKLEFILGWREAVGLWDILAVHHWRARYAAKPFWETFEEKKERNGLSQWKIEDLTRQMSEWALKVNQLHQKPLERLQMQYSTLRGSTQDGCWIAVDYRPWKTKFAEDLTQTPPPLQKSENFIALRGHVLFFS